MTNVSRWIQPMLLVLSLALLAQPSAQAEGKWIKLAPFPEPAEELLGVAAAGKMYVFCGLAPVWKPIGTVYEYDPATDTWGSARARMPSARSAMASGVHGGRIYVTGGEGQNAQMMYTFRALEAYDPATNTWAVLPSMPVSRHGLAGAVIGNRLHMVSGDVQSAGTGVQVHSDSHDAFEFDDNRN
jgi:N-acetylneuraminic acid mutarotase